MPKDAPATVSLKRKIIPSPPGSMHPGRIIRIQFPFQYVGVFLDDGSQSFQSFFNIFTVFVSHRILPYQEQIGRAHV